MLLHLTSSIISDGKNILLLYQQLLNVFKSAALTPTDTKRKA